MKFSVRVVFSSKNTGKALLGQAFSRFILASKISATKEFSTKSSVLLGIKVSFFSSSESLLRVQRIFEIV